jgi:Leucine Rich repeat
VGYLGDALRVGGVLGKLRELDLSDNELGAEGVQCLGDALGVVGVLASLRELDITANAVPSAHPALRALRSARPSNLAVAEDG